MKKFLVLYHAPIDAMQQMTNVSQEEQAKGMEAWMQWAKKSGDKLIELGAPLTNGQVLSPDGSVGSSSKEVCGYSILQAENMDEAEELLKGHPHIAGWDPKATIEVHETMALPGM